MKRLFIVFLLLLMDLCVHGQSQQQETLISGRAVLLSQMRVRVGGNRAGGYTYEQAIIDSPAMGAKVELILQGETYAATTDLNGSFMIRNLHPGLVQITISYPPLKPISGSFELLPGIISSLHP